MFVKPMSGLSFSEKGLEPKTGDLEIDYEVGVFLGAVLVFSLEKRFSRPAVVSIRL